MSALPLSELIQQPVLAGKQEPLWLSQQRLQAAKYLQASGLPAEGSENWRYSSLRRLQTKLLEQPTELHLTEPQLLASAGLQATDNRMVFANGIYQAHLSLVPAGLRISNLNSQLHTAELESLMQTVPTATDCGFSWLNTTAFNDGLFIHLDAGQVLEAPLHFIQLGGGNSLINSRHIISLGEAAKLTLIEQFIEATEMPPTQGLFNCQTDVHLAKSARLDWSRVQALGASAVLVDRVNCWLGENSHLHSSQLDCGGLWVRHDVDVALNEPGAFVEVNGVLMLRGRQHCDVHTKIVHAAINCTSRETFKCIADDRSRGVFNGKILVQPGADGTDSAQRSDNLLLSEHARIDTKPDLEILTDDVVASHGATVGQLDEDALFYIRSRGIDSPAAKKLLMRAFYQQVVELIAEPRAQEAFTAKLDQIFEHTGKSV